MYALEIVVRKLYFHIKKATSSSHPLKLEKSTSPKLVPPLGDRLTGDTSLGESYADV
jgi:hypothetical protein